jgi:hypothetical protein
MAESPVKLRIFADAAAAERAIVGLEKKYSDLEQKIKRLGTTSRDEVGVGTAIASSIAGFATVATLVRGATAAYREWRQEIKGAADQEEQFSRNLIANLAQVGRLAQGPKIKAFLQGIPGVREDQARAAFAGVAAGGPTLPIERVMELTTAGAALAPLFAPLDEQGKVSNTAELERLNSLIGKLGEALPAKGAGDIADLAVAAEKFGERINTPGFERAVLELQKGGMGGERAIASVLTAIDTGISPAKLSGKSLSKAIRGLDQDKIAAIEADLVTAQQEDRAMLALQQGAAIAPVAFARQGIFARDEKADRGIGRLEQALEVNRQAAIEEAPGILRPFAKFAQWLGVGVRSTAGGMFGEGGMAALSPESIQQTVGADVQQTLTEIKGLHQETNDLLRHQKPPINRQAQGE